MTTPWCFFETIPAASMLAEHIVLYPTGGGNLNGLCPKFALAKLVPLLLPKAGVSVPDRFE